jgi:hypothetical protein
MNAREVAIQLAISDLHAGLYSSQRAAAKAYGVPESTLRNRLNGATNSALSHQHQQRMTPAQEDFLVDWILDEDARACPPSHARAREMANRILRMNGDNNPVGKLWISHFIKRQPRVASIIGRMLEVQRADAATPAQVQAFLELFERTRIRLNIRTEDIRAGRLATGLSPFNIKKVLASPQLSQRPTTPTRQQQSQQQHQEVFSTPQGPRDLYLAQREIQSCENLGRKTRLLLQKASKALGVANTRVAGLEAEKRRLEQQLETASSKRPRKRV